MKKYRLTKVRIKTREIISVAGYAETENQAPVCPVCHSPLAAALSPIERNGAQIAEADIAQNLLNDHLTQKQGGI
jgi:hypothetical protein